MEQQPTWLGAVWLTWLHSLRLIDVFQDQVAFTQIELMNCLEWAAQVCHEKFVNVFILNTNVGDTNFATSPGGITVVRDERSHYLHTMRGISNGTPANRVNLTIDMLLMNQSFNPFWSSTKPTPSTFRKMSEGFSNEYSAMQLLQNCDTTWPTLTKGMLLELVSAIHKAQVSQLWERLEISSHLFHKLIHLRRLMPHQLGTISILMIKLGFYSSNLLLIMTELAIITAAVKAARGSTLQHLVPTLAPIVEVAC